MRALIVGYGRAGRRHASTLRSLVPNMSVVAVDPFVIDDDVLFPNLDIALKGKYDFAVICTPPDQHLEGIRACLDKGVKAIMCEKPVCGIGQIKEAEKLQDAPVMISHNYLFHQELMRALARERQPGKTWQFYSDQQRVDWPAWGIPLENLSHTFSILGALAGAATIDSAIQLVHKADDGFTIGEALWIQGRTANGTKVEIADCVRKHPVERKAWANGPCGYLDFSLVGDMFDKMWLSFLHILVTQGKFIINIKEALAAQRLIEDTNRILVRKDTPWGTVNSFWRTAERS